MMKKLILATAILAACAGAAHGQASTKELTLAKMEMEPEGVAAALDYVVSQGLYDKRLGYHGELSLEEMGEGSLRLSVSLLPDYQGWKETAPAGYTEAAGYTFAVMPGDDPAATAKRAKTSASGGRLHLIIDPDAASAAREYSWIFYIAADGSTSLFSAFDDGRPERQKGLGQFTLLRMELKSEALAEALSAVASSFSPDNYFPLLRFENGADGEAPMATLYEVWRKWTTTPTAYAGYILLDGVAIVVDQEGIENFADWIGYAPAADPRKFPARLTRQLRTTCQRVDFRLQPDAPITPSSRNIQEWFNATVDLIYVPAR